ncbi:MAG: hypothetical protein LH477_08865 [Nocardioides sp.]|nr:hypothetical protein [Nocardioides sp.]
MLLAVASGTTYALTTVAGGSISRTASHLVLTSGMTLVGAAVLLPRLAFVDGPVVTRDPTALAWLGYLVEPGTAAGAAALVLDEPLGRVAVLGILLVLGAVAGLGRPTTAAGPVALGPDVS